MASAFNIRAYENAPAKLPKLKAAKPAPIPYRLVESVDGGEFTPVTFSVHETDSVNALTLARWMAARVYYWQTQGYTTLTTSQPNQVIARKPKSHERVIVRVEEKGL